MYFYKIDKASLDKYCSMMAETEAGEQVYADLCNHKYDIFWTRSKNGDGTLRYVAIAKEAVLDHPFLTFDLSVTKNVSLSNAPLSIDGDSVYCAFVYYLGQQEKDASEEKLKERYGDDYSSLLPYASLSMKEAESINEARESLKSLQKELLNSYKVGGESKLHIYFCFYLNRGDSVRVRLRAGFSKLYAVSNIDNFMRNVKDRNYLSLGNGKQVGQKDSYELDEKVEAPFLELAHHKNNRYYCSYNEADLTSSDFVELLFTLIGESVDIDDRTYLVEEPIEESVSINEKGSIVSSLKVEGKTACFISKEKVVAFNLEKKALSLHFFPSKNACALFKFALENKDFPYEFFASSIGEDIVPLLDSGTKVDESFKISHPSSKAEIEYSLSYEENGTLLAKTKYLLSLNEVSEESFATSGEANSLRLRRFLNALDTLSLPKDGTVSDEMKIVAFLSADLSLLSSSCKLLLSENLANRKMKKLENIKIVTSSGEDWFSASLESDKYSTEELEAIYDAYKKKKKFVHFKGSFITLDDDNIVKELSSDFSIDDFGKKLPLYQALKLENYKKESESLTSTLRSMLLTIGNYKDFPLDGLSPFLAKTLRPYQKDGVRWLLAHDKYELGGLLADEMGLGKTLETIAFLSLKEADGPILIVSPKSLIYNWASEFFTFDKGKKVHVMDGSVADREKMILFMKKAQNEVFIMSYDSLRNDIDKLKNIEFSYLFLDEAQFIANAFAKKSKAVKELKSKHRFVLTGTPIQNNLLDLWSIFDFLLPGYLPSYKDFKGEYGELSYQDDESKMRLARKVAPFYLQRKKMDVLKELPPKEEKRLTIALDDEQRRIYEAHLRKTRELLKGTKEHHEAKDKGKDKIAILASLTRLREICVDPSMILEGAASGAKFESLLDNIQIAISGGHKVLIFSSYVKALKHFASELRESGIDSYLIYGDTQAKERIALASSFNDENDPVKVMLVSLKAGGTGLNLVGADIVYHLDPWWNVAAENQASDRAHRMGQKKKVTIFKLIAKDTIEEKVLSLQEKKQDLASILSKSDSLSLLSEEDIMYLLS